MGCIGKAPVVGTAQAQEIDVSRFAIDSAGGFHAEGVIADQFFGVDVDDGTAHIAGIASAEGLEDIDVLNDIRPEELQGDILVFRIFRRDGETVEEGGIVAIT